MRRRQPPRPRHHRHRVHLPREQLPELPFDERVRRVSDGVFREKGGGLGPRGDFGFRDVCRGVDGRAVGGRWGPLGEGGEVASRLLLGQQGCCRGCGCGGGGRRGDDVVLELLLLRQRRGGGGSRSSWVGGGGSCSRRGPKEPPGCDGGTGGVLPRGGAVAASSSRGRRASSSSRAEQGLRRERQQPQRRWQRRKVVVVVVVAVAAASPGVISGDRGRGSRGGALPSRPPLRRGQRLGAHRRGLAHPRRFFLPAGVEVDDVEEALRRGRPL